MNWNDRLLGAADLGAFVVRASGDNDSEQVALPPEGGTTNGLAKALLRQQIATWPMLRDATAALDRAEYKEFSVKGTKVLAQFNPARIVSTGAKVDAATIQQRPCFLCADNLPAEEKGVAFGSDFVVLCNPFPVMRDHLVVSSRRHTPQTIEGNYDVMLNLARELGPDWFVLYNGPRCGASAPDHLHFQACARPGVPLFDDFDFWLTRDSTEAGYVVRHNYRLNLLACGSSDREELIYWVRRIIQHLAAVTRSETEPMVNLIATYQNGKWSVFIMARAKHRPSCYDAEGDTKLTVSPAAIDLAGVVVVPQPDHFARISANDLRLIYEEVGLDDARLIEWLKRINGDRELKN